MYIEKYHSQNCFFKLVAVQVLAQKTVHFRLRNLVKSHHFRVPKWTINSIIHTYTYIYRYITFFTKRVTTSLVSRTQVFTNTEITKPYLQVESWSLFEQVRILIVSFVSLLRVHLQYRKWRHYSRRFGYPGLLVFV